jgi:hypothetical protein
MGMEAETVRPALRARYTVAAPKRIPEMHPRIIALRVNSFIFVSAGTKGWKVFGVMNSLVGKLLK